MKTLNAHNDFHNVIELMGMYPLISIMCAIVGAFYIANKMTSKG